MLRFDVTSINGVSTGRGLSHGAPWLKIWPRPTPSVFIRFFNQHKKSVWEGHYIRLNISLILRFYSHRPPYYYLNIYSSVKYCFWMRYFINFMPLPSEFDSKEAFLRLTKEINMRKTPLYGHRNFLLENLRIKNANIIFHKVYILNFQKIYGVKI